MGVADSRRRAFQVLLTSLRSERQSFIPHWRDLSEYFLPRRAIFSITDSNKGQRKNLKIIDSTGTMSIRTLKTSMQSFITSPARPWKRITTQDKKLSELLSVKEWLQVVSKRMDSIFLKSNLYDSLPICYGDMSLFATGAMIVEEDFDNVIHTFVFPIGTYMLATDDRQKVVVFAREFQMTVRQLMDKFGERDDNGKIKFNNFSNTVKNLYDRNQLDVHISVAHIIQPNKDYSPKDLTSKKFESVYYELSTGGRNSKILTNSNVYLRDRGYDYFPVLAPRWETSGEDVYGSDCPGMTALGPVKALQTMQKRKAQAIEKMINPPMIAPYSMKNSRTSILPGDTTYGDEREGQKGFRPAHEVRVELGALSKDIQDIQSEVRDICYVNLFLMLTMSDRREITAREVEERHQEKLSVLGGVLERVNNDLLDPLIDITFALMEKQGLIPEPPPELAGKPLKIEYVSIMHEAQKLAGLAAIERTARFVQEVAAFKPDVVDKLDGDQLIEEHGDITGVPPKILVPDDIVLEIRQKRAADQAAQAQSQQIQSMGAAAKDLSSAKMDGDNALTALLKQSQAGA